MDSVVQGIPVKPSNLNKNEVAQGILPVKSSKTQMDVESKPIAYPKIRQPSLPSIKELKLKKVSYYKKKIGISP